MQHSFDMSMIRELHHFLGLQINQTKSGIMLSQTQYARDLVKKFGFESGGLFTTPMAVNIKLGADHHEKEVDQTLYRSMIGSLLYLTASRPDISFSVGLCARFQANPRESL